MILPFITQHLDSLQLWQFWHKHHSKPGWPEKGLSKTLLSICFLLITVHHCSPSLFSVSQSLRSFND
ncbi:hypothetical protein DFZ77_07250 [Escherichia coli]|nr:hypothetical protein [Escherichia coli]EFC6944656.1 hypothetical protein [Escherichia coli]EFD0677146.1 hypothetical protein [Escherichia coli]